MNRRNHIEDLRGASRLAVEATRGVTDLVEAMHQTIAAGPAQLLEAPAKLLTGWVYASIRGVTELVGATIDVALAQLAPLLAESAPGPEREAVLSVLNGVLGDYLSATQNPLAIEMRFRQEGEPGNKLLVLLHGSCMSDRQWTRAGHDHGAQLARELGYTPLYLRYNSGLHVSISGRALADELDRLVSGWPVPVEELVLLGFSMGGLVARSACHYGQDRAWRRSLGKLVCVGTPHHGAPLERGGNLVDVLLGVSRYSAPLARLGRIRSAGVTDLRFGMVRDEEWQGRDRFEHAADPRLPLPLPEGVACQALAGTRSPAPSAKLLSDGLVPVDSALGRHDKLALDFADTQIVYGVGHLDLLASAEVYQTLLRWMR